MTDDFGWLADLTEELRRRGLVPDQVRQVVDEAAAHLRDSGERASVVFGTVERYAAAVADSLGHPAAHDLPRARGPLRLSARGIGKRYGRRHVLRGVDLDVHAGEVAAVVGANGCGKSTFLRILAGIASPDTGHVAVDGSLGYCPQDAGTSDFLSPDEHFVLVGAGRGLARGRARDDGRGHARALRWAQPDACAAGRLSGGTRQKLNVVLAALGDPDILLLDEPYQGFDRGSYLDFWERVWMWRDAGKAVVVVTHLLDRLDRADTVLDLTEAPASTGTRTAARPARKRRGGR